MWYKTALYSPSEIVPAHLHFNHTLRHSLKALCKFSTVRLLSTWLIKPRCRLYTIVFSVLCQVETRSLYGWMRRSSTSVRVYVDFIRFVYSTVFKTVSYTHLDVYKRQTIAFLNNKFNCFHHAFMRKRSHVCFPFTISSHLKTNKQKISPWHNQIKHIVCLITCTISVFRVKIPQTTCLTVPHLLMSHCDPRALNHKSYLS